MGRFNSKVCLQFCSYICLILPMVPESDFIDNFLRETIPLYPFRTICYLFSYVFKYLIHPFQLLDYYYYVTKGKRFFKLNQICSY